MNLFKRAAITATVPLMALGLAGGAISMLGGSAATAGVQGPPPIHIPPPVVREFPAKAIPFGEVSCVKANALETAELNALKADEGVLLWQAAHTTGGEHLVLAFDANYLAGQIKTLSAEIVPCPVFYFCPRGTVLETIKEITPGATPWAPKVVTTLHECVIEGHELPPVIYAPKV